MFRLTASANMLTAACEASPTFHQTVRIPVRPKIPEEETIELRRLYNHYRTAIKSIRHFLYEKHSVQLQAKADTELLRKAFEEDLARCNEINDRWNEELRRVREERITKELEVEKQLARDRMDSVLKEKELELAHAEELVRREKECSKTFITRENLDDAIEKAIENPTTYNFAIDLQGNKIVEGGTQPEVKVATKQ